ncbi:MAG: fibronectin type III domain-containing protein [Bacteroidia bacterium]|nr:fibronectin type III domain-containing protein [Bacteroidia bacterium]
MKTLIFTFGLFLLFIIANAQQNANIALKQFKCGTTEYMQQLTAENPSMEINKQNLEKFTKNWIKNNPNGSKATITIPVVIHIVYNTTAENISDTRITEQINALNRDYAGLNTASMQAFSTTLKANTGLQFCLAQRDPNGNATTGIERRQTTVTSFSYTNDPVKHYSTGGLDAWDPTKYMNIWVCNLGTSLCGYAQFPVATSVITNGGVNSTFGVVIHYAYFGVTGTTAPLTKGCTTTHEIGHCFNLYHIWGDVGDTYLNNCAGSDQCTDTPNQAMSTSMAQTSTTYTGAKYDGCTYSYPGIMYVNFMDYTGDQEWACFTPNQTARIQACFASGGPLYSLTTSTACTPPTTACGTPTGLTASSITTTSAALGWTAVTGATSYNIQYRVVGAATWTSATSTTNSLSVSGLTAATNYEFQVQTVCASGTGAFSASATFTTLSATSTCGLPTGLTATSITSASATLGWTAVTGATSYNIQYRVVGAATWTSATSTTNSLVVSGLTAATNYEFQVQTVCTSGTSAFSASATFATLSVTTTCTDIYESNNSLIYAKLISVNTNITASISSATDVDYFKFSNTIYQPNIQITLTNLPADYKLELYSIYGILLGYSNNAGTLSEKITFN